MRSILLKSFAGACLLVSIDARAGIVCPEKLESEERPLSDFSRGANKDVLSRAALVPTKVHVAFEPSTEVDLGDGVAKPVCAYEIVIDTKLHDLFQHEISRELSKRNSCEEKVGGSVGHWKQTSDHRAVGRVSVHAKINECTETWWFKCTLYGKCRKRYRTWSIHLGEAEADFEVAVASAAPDGNPAFFIESVKRDGDVDVSGRGIFQWADVPLWVADWFVDGSIEGLMTKATTRANDAFGASAVLGANPCMKSGGVKGGAEICIRDPLSDKRRNYHFAIPVFGIENGLSASSVARKTCTPGRCRVIREYFDEVDKFARNSPGLDHLVESGESLWGLSQMMYGSGRHWVALAAYNRLEIGSPTLHPGDLVHLPRPSTLYDTDSPAVVLRGSSWWQEWVEAEATCPEGTSRVSWEEFSSQLPVGGAAYQGERPQMCKP